jgi:hypothetical protein
MSAQLRLAFHPVGGWTTKDVFATPTLGTYHWPLFTRRSGSQIRSATCVDAG